MTSTKKKGGINSSGVGGLRSIPSIDSSSNNEEQPAAHDDDSVDTYALDYEDDVIIIVDSEDESGWDSDDCDFAGKGDPDQSEDLVEIVEDDDDPEEHTEGAHEQAAPSLIQEAEPKPEQKEPIAQVEKKPGTSVEGKPQPVETVVSPKKKKKKVVAADGAPKSPKKKGKGLKGKGNKVQKKKTGKKKAAKDPDSSEDVSETAKDGDEINGKPPAGASLRPGMMRGDSFGDDDFPQPKKKIAETPRRGVTRTTSFENESGKIVVTKPAGGVKAKACNHEASVRPGMLQGSSFGDDDFPAPTKEAEGAPCRGVSRTTSFENESGKIVVTKPLNSNKSNQGASLRPGIMRGGSFGDDEDNIENGTERKSESTSPKSGVSPRPGSMRGKSVERDTGNLSNADAAESDEKPSSDPSEKRAKPRKFNQGASLRPGMIRGGSFREDDKDEKEDGSSEPKFGLSLRPVSSRGNSIEPRSEQTVSKTEKNMQGNGEDSSEVPEKKGKFNYGASLRPGMVRGASFGDHDNGEESESRRPFGGSLRPGSARESSVERYDSDPDQGNEDQKSDLSGTSSSKQKGASLRPGTERGHSFDGELEGFTPKAPEKVEKKIKKKKKNGESESGGKIKVKKVKKKKDGLSKSNHTRSASLTEPTSLNLSQSTHEPHAKQSRRASMTSAAPSSAPKATLNEKKIKKKKDALSKSIHAPRQTRRASMTETTSLSQSTHGPREKHSRRASMTSTTPYESAHMIPKALPGDVDDKEKRIAWEKPNWITSPVLRPSPRKQPGKKPVEWQKPEWAVKRFKALEGLETGGNDE